MTQAVRPRPLSPHLSIYRPQISTVLSISHRITGVALAVGTLLLTAWLWSAAYEPQWFDWLSAFFKTWFGQALLFGWSFAMFYHLCNGIRHLFWDMGVGFTIPVFTKSGIAVVIATLVLTLGTWGYVYSVGLKAGGTAHVTSGQ